MMNSRKSTLLLAVSWVILTLNVHAEEKRLKKSDLPLPVQKTADGQSKGATVKGYSKEVEHGKLQYEVELIIDGRGRDMTIAPDGRVLEVEEALDFGDLPVAVREGLQSKAAGAKIVKVESIVKNGKLVAYEAQVYSRNKRSEIQVGPNGKPLDHEE